MAKDKQYIKLIHTARWLRLRRDILTKQPICKRCEGIGRISAATEVHHTRPVEEAISYTERKRRMYDPHNLMGLCHKCHVEVHTEMGRSGKDATRKRNEKHAAEIVDRFFNDE